MSEINDNKKAESKFSHIIRAKSSTIAKDALMLAMKSFYPLVKDRLPKREEYSEEIREIYDMFSRIEERDYQQNKVKWRMLRDLICFICQYDPAYFLPLLDGLEEVNFNKLKITCPMDCLVGRSYQYGGAEKWKKRLEEYERSLKKDK